MLSLRSVGRPGHAESSWSSDAATIKLGGKETSPIDWGILASFDLNQSNIAE